MAHWLSDRVKFFLYGIRLETLTIPLYSNQIDKNGFPPLSSVPL